MMSMRSLEELVTVDDPALPVLESWIASASNRIELLPAERTAGERCTPQACLGAGGRRLPRDLVIWNELTATQHRLSGAMLVADDAVGGFFAINGNAFDGPLGNVWYLAPDTLAWEDCGRSYADWLHWACTGDLARFYESMRWPGWKAEVASLDTSQVLSIYPFLFVDGESIAERSRRPVPIAEQWHLHALELPRQLAEE